MTRADLLRELFSYFGMQKLIRHLTRYRKQQKTFSWMWRDKEKQSTQVHPRGLEPALRKFVVKDNISRNLEEEMLRFRAFTNNMQFLAPKAQRRKSFPSSMLLHCLRSLLPHQQKIICHFTMKTVWFLAALAVTLG